MQYTRLRNVCGSVMTHSLAAFLISLHVSFVVVVLLYVQVRIPVQSVSTAQGSSGVRLHQQARHPQSDQTDHTHPQQGESLAHHTVSVQ